MLTCPRFPSLQRKQPQPVMCTQLCAQHWSTYKEVHTLQKRKKKSLHKVKTRVGQQEPMAGDTTACPDLPCQSCTPFLSYEAELPGFTTALHKVY